MFPVPHPVFFGDAGFLTRVARRKAVVQLGSLGEHCKPSPVESRGKYPENFGYFEIPNRYSGFRIALVSLSYHEV